MANGLKIKFWGVRGSIPSGNQETAGVGGNTTCVEIRCGDELIIIDTGTGVRSLGLALSCSAMFIGTIYKDFLFLRLFLFPAMSSGFLGAPACRRPLKKF